MATTSSNSGSAGGVAGGNSSKSDSMKRGIRYSHFARMESTQVLEAATLDLVNIFKLKVGFFYSEYYNVLSQYTWSLH